MREGGQKRRGRPPSTNTLEVPGALMWLLLKMEEALSGLRAGAYRAAAAQDTEQHSPKHKRSLFASLLISAGVATENSSAGSGRRGRCGPQIHPAARQTPYSPPHPGQEASAAGKQHFWFLLQDLQALSKAL